MALNTILLNGVIVCNMYRNSIVDIVETRSISQHSANDITPTQKKEPNGQVWPSLGQFKKHILIIVRYSDSTGVPAKALNFLNSVLEACKLGLPDVAVLNISNAPSQLLKDIQEKFKSRLTFLFGVAPQSLEMPINFPEFQVQPSNGCTYLHTPTLEELESDKVLKSKLWVCLRKIFDI